MSRYCNACPTVLADSEATPTCMAYIELQWQLEKCRKSPPKQRIEKANVNERKQAKKKVATRRHENRVLHATVWKPEEAKQLN